MNTGALGTPSGGKSHSYQQVNDIFAEDDLMQAHQMHPGSFAKVISRRIGVPSVSRESNLRCGFSRRGRIANGLIHPLLRFVVCNSQAGDAPLPGGNGCCRTINPNHPKRCGLRPYRGGDSAVLKRPQGGIDPSGFSTRRHRLILLRIIGTRGPHQCDCSGLQAINRTVRTHPCR